ncbi:hypothetical protein Scep_024176 [Stephania cephalantha]|uniref:Uncharacterized protein n=1 Tax=Stephania cephalantha TaxID=152367 RepID=A0AAP0EW30_9MAGN
MFVVVSSLAVVVVLSVPLRRLPLSSVAIVSSLHCSHCFRDAADQTAIDNYMVQQLDGTGALTNHVANAFCGSSSNPSSHMLTASSVLPLLQCILQQNTVQRAKLQMRRQELTQTTSDQPMDDEAVYYKVAGECPNGRVYGLGSLGRKKRRYTDVDASTSQVLAQPGMDNFMILRSCPGWAYAF